MWKATIIKYNDNRNLYTLTIKPMLRQRTTQSISEIVHKIIPSISDLHTYYFGKHHLSDSFYIRLQKIKLPIKTQKLISTKFNNLIF